MPAEPLLVVRDLGVTFATSGADVHAVRGISFDLRRGECLAVVGESGSGKSQSAMALMGLLPENGRSSGSAKLDGTELIGLADPSLNRIRGRRIGIVFQDPLSSLAPHIRVGEQIATPMRTHLGLSASQAMEKAREWLDRVHFPDPARSVRQYPHELSGGMRQRVMIAGALACGPDLLIADEPTTALDVTVQAEVLDLLDHLVKESGTSLLLITHDMGVVARMADRVCVMRTGEYVEQGTAEEVLTRPQHPYTRTLLAAVPSVRSESLVNRLRSAAADRPIFEIDDLSVSFPLPVSLFRKRQSLRAVNDVSLSVRAGETLAIVGESGSGKSTLVRAALKLIQPDSGRVMFAGNRLDFDGRNALLEARKQLQIIFQDPLGSLDPSMTVTQSIAEPLLVHHKDLSSTERRELLFKALADVGLGPEFADRYPHQLSGGQAQRVGIARAIVLRPKVLICDEAVSALDVSIRAEIIALLLDLQRRLGLAMLFISHDLAVVRQVAHRVLVLYRGEVVEQGAADELFAAPQHPYTQRLLNSVLGLDRSHGSSRPASGLLEPGI